MKNGLSSMSVEQPLPNHPYGQTLHLLTEMLSEEICAPDNRDPFSGLKLTPQTEAKMNTMHALQSQLMLKGIAYLRAQFEEQLATLPDICMNTYISRSDRLNEPDLYRKMTHDWGLYDPVAKAVLRLVREAYGKLRSLPPEKSTPEFKALSPAEQLRQVIANMLTEWDKIDEIVAELRETTGDDNETVHELLFAQWRQLCEVFNVEKERFVLFGPKRPSADDAPETRIPFLDMDVDPGTKPH